ncbi:MAG TPA: GspH/FimT family pseudopilin [Steroidobacteraceae bacterium]|nr:GspH/FimT family pseudopilin [Steroidobacteraceae bacterium]
MTREAGFTLTELMVTLTIVAILTGIGVPSYKYITKSDRVSTEINALLGDLQFARAEAIREGQTVNVCPAADTNYTSCATTADSWTGGWLVWTDLDGNGTLDAGEVLRVGQAFSAHGSTDTLGWNGTVTAVAFNREGFASALGGPTAYTLHDSTSNPNYTRCLTLQISGLATTATHTSDPTNCN